MDDVSYLLQFKQPKNVLLFLPPKISKVWANEKLAIRINAIKSRAFFTVNSFLKSKHFYLKFLMKITI